MVKWKSKSFPEVQYLSGFLNKEREANMWEAVFSAEESKSCNKNVLDVFKEQNGGQSGRARHRLGGTGITEVAV